MGDGIEDLAIHVRHLPAGWVLSVRMSIAARNGRRLCAVVRSLDVTAVGAG